jgi:hypothetical protein
MYSVPLRSLARMYVAGCRSMAFPVHEQIHWIPAYAGMTEAN